MEMGDLQRTPRREEVPLRTHVQQNAVPQRQVQIARHMPSPPHRPARRTKRLVYGDSYWSVLADRHSPPSPRLCAPLPPERKGPHPMLCLRGTVFLKRTRFFEHVFPDCRSVFRYRTRPVGVFPQVGSARTRQTGSKTLCPVSIAPHDSDAPQVRPLIPCGETPVPAIGPAGPAHGLSRLWRGKSARSPESAGRGAHRRRPTRGHADLWKSASPPVSLPSGYSEP